ncbi:probable tRNA (uracil-O(2)-)-methyltransferase [Hyalella azteca]|uniref:tRNA (uracil-O(2)-)-methyltransferase n=1 Tax=Hyalella azteca TaxID=294128 RepID=A0A8B7PPV5_HYAAZ|nr:probable tRNA (uracil-O(2)-)-methyltransferase [Hyalella azteca]XP_018027481.1 probable tRNA (uracil-O(2)-)-methyltransferase [Hyalella azteca]
MEKHNMDHDSEDGATPTLSKKAKIVEAPAVMSNEIPLNNLIDVSSGCCCLESNDAYTSPGLPGSFSDRQAFWEALKVHVERPHILNRRLCGAVDIWWGILCNNFPTQVISDATGKSEKNNKLDLQVEVNKIPGYQNTKSSTIIDYEFSPNSRNLHLSDLASIWQVLNSASQVEDLNESPGEPFAANSSLCSTKSKMMQLQTKVTRKLTEIGFKEFTSKEALAEAWLSLEKCSCCVVVRKVLPKLQERYATVLEVIVLDGANDCCIFLNSTALPPLLPARPYMISLITSAGAAVEGETIAVCGLFKSTYLAGVPQLTAEGGPTGDGRAWLQGTVLPRLHKWAKPRVSQETAIRSLQLINLQSYGLLYHNLKTKYANHLIQSWSERTDPKKFVHEDIGIATYLLLLWSQHSRPQRFIDLGCGNGLLVYILTKEGHCGTGYDIKSRNIWLERFSDIDLQELEVTPNTTSFSADVDWLIGNHSDELTPWLPVMAARTSHFCSFFLLPCCPHDFTTKFLRRNTKKSQYGDYLDYVEVIGRVCGFNVERDRLKIPSTKRECFVGRSKLHTEQERPSVLTSIQEFIDSRVAANVSNLGRGTDLKRSGDFVARPKEQRVRNCTQLARGVKEDLVQCVVRLLLGDGDKKEEWWAGGSIELRDAAASLTAEQLRQMKQECGGLKTLLKNHRHIFLLQGSQVQLRAPGRVAEFEKRQRPCWFSANHPQGCPNSADECMYCH